VVQRKDVASWLDGTGRPAAPGQEQAYAGQRLGRPATGPGAVAGFGARLVAYLLDSLGALHTERAQLTFTTPNRPALVRPVPPPPAEDEPAPGPGYLHLLMPVRLPG